MAEEDIYKSKKRYESFVKRIPTLTKKPKSGSKKIYYCKNKENLQYFYELIKYFEMKDLAYIRRLRVFGVLKVITYVCIGNLVDCTCSDINQLVAFSHTRYKTPISKADFIKDLKIIWKILFPVKDEKGRVDDTLVPYVVRHLSRRIDKSKQKLRNEKLTSFGA